MLALTPFLVFFAFLAAHVLAVPAAVCSKAPYKALLALSAVPAAEKFCSSKFPLPACTSTATSTTTSVSVATQTVTAATNTVTTTTQTVYITTGTTTVDQTVATVQATITPATITSTTTVISTITTATTTTQTSIQDVGLRKRAPTPANGNPISSLLSSLEAQASNIIKTACSCIEVQPPCTTVTTVATIPSVSTTTTFVTATASVAYTTTLNLVETDTSLITSTQTNTITAFTTVPTTETVTTTVISTTTAVVTDTYTKVYQNTGTGGSAYNHYADAYDYGSSGDPAVYAASCAAQCDAYPGCKSFYVSYFPPCQGTGGDVFCTVDTIPYDSGYLQTGIGNDYRGCPIYTKGEAYNRV